MQIPERSSELQRARAGIWWLVLLRGAVLALLGVLLIARPAGTVGAMLWVMGVTWFADGVLTFVQSIQGRRALPRWGWGVVAGFVGMVAGIAVFSRPLLAAVFGAAMIVYVVAFVAIASGISAIFTGVRLRRQIENEWSMILGGVLYVLLGTVLIGHPLGSALVLAWTAGLLVLCGGVGLAVLAFRIRRMGRSGIAIPA